MDEGVLHTRVEHNDDGQLQIERNHDSIMPQPQDQSLKNKRILFFGLEAFGYRDIILSEMRAQAAAVDYFNSKPVTSNFGKAVLKFAPWLLKPITRRYFHRVLRQIESNAYDIVLMMRCDSADKTILKRYRKAFPKAEFRLYLWDSLRNILGIRAKLACFDRVLSFDRHDCLEHPAFAFRPLFFSDHFSSRAADPGKAAYDISFCGTIHSDRYVVIQKIKRWCAQAGLRSFFYPYFQSGFVYWAYRIKDKRYRKTLKSEFVFKQMPVSEVVKLMADSKAVLDIHHPSQSGLTMRTIETLGAGRKLVTTNADIAHYDFYNPANILIIDREHPALSKEFFNTDYAQPDGDVYRRYTIAAWVRDVLQM